MMHKSTRTTWSALVVAMAALLGARPARAQMLGYAIAGPAGYSGFFGSQSNSVHWAGGGEALPVPYVGAGGEFGMLNRLLVGSLTGTAHFRNVHASGVIPFVSGGWSKLGIGDGEGSFSAKVIAFGIDAAISTHRAVRVEYRDHIRSDSRGNVHYWSFRGGIVFR